MAKDTGAARVAKGYRLELSGKSGEYQTLSMVRTLRRQSITMVTKETDV